MFVLQTPFYLTSMMHLLDSESKHEIFVSKSNACLQHAFLKRLHKLMFVAYLYISTVSTKQMEF